MARVNNKSILKGISGKIGPDLVAKQYAHYGTIISVTPDMSKVKKSILQKQEGEHFAKAVAYAQAIIRDAKKKAAYAKRLPKGKRVFNAAIQEYLEKHPK